MKSCDLLKESSGKVLVQLATRYQDIHPRGAVLDLLLLESWLPFLTVGWLLILALTCQLLVMEVYKGINC